MEDDENDELDVELEEEAVEGEAVEAETEEDEEAAGVVLADVEVLVVVLEEEVKWLSHWNHLDWRLIHRTQLVYKCSRCLGILSLRS